MAAWGPGIVTPLLPEEVGGVPARRPGTGVCDTGAAEKEAQVSDENLGAFPGRSWGRITIRSPELVHFLHALLCTPSPLAEELAIISIFVSSRVKIRPGSRGGKVTGRSPGLA